MASTDLNTWTDAPQAQLPRLVGFARLGFVLVLICLIFVPFGRVLGDYFERTPARIRAYSVNVAGSIVGIWSFAALSFAEQSPVVWLALAAGLIAAPVVVLVPPHAPWALGALGIGLLTARRRWGEEQTLHSLKGACPRCGESITLSRPTRLRHPHAISCPSCHYELALSVDL